MKSSRSLVSDIDLQRAEAAMARSDARFHSVRACLRWAFRAAHNLQEPLPDLVRRHARNGLQVRVDGGAGSSVDDVLASLATVRSGLQSLSGVDGGRKMVELIRLAYEEGYSQAEIEKLHGYPQQWVSQQLDRAEWFLAGPLIDSGLVAEVKRRKAG